jgi:hypothetical protein
MSDVQVSDWSTGTVTMTATLTLAGVPPSWQNWRGHWKKTWSMKKYWHGRAHLCAQDARNRMQWNLPAKGERAVVTIVLHRVKELDHDNAYSSVKPILDGLQEALIYSDAPSFCELTVRQERVKHYADQLTVITVEKQHRPRGHSGMPTLEDITRADIRARNEAELEGSGR